MNAGVEKEDFNNYKLIREFLLHQLDGKTSLEVEEKFFCDPTFQESVLITEEELMEDYALNRLTSDERIRVQKYLLSTQTQIKKLRSIEEIINEVVNLREKPYSDKVGFPKLDLTKEIFIEKAHNFYIFFSKGLILYPLLILVVCSLAVFVYIYQENSSFALSKRIEQLNRDPKDSFEGLTKSIFEIRPNIVRDSASGENQVVIKPQDNIIEYHLLITHKQYETYQVSLKKFNNQPFITLKDLYVSEKNGTHFLNILFPVEIFTDDYYVFDVAGMTKDKELEEIESFTFKIVRTY